MKVSVLGIDLGKSLCSIVGFDETGAVVLRRRAKRETLIGLAAKVPPCIVAMEACFGAHHLGRLFANQGHDVRLMSPEYVRPYIKAQKNDDRDAEGIAEAATRPTMPSLSLPPLEFCLGVRPSQAANSRPDLKNDGSGTVAAIADAVKMPMPGIVASRRLVSFLLCQALISRSRVSTCSSRVCNCRTKGCKAARARAGRL